MSGFLEHLWQSTLVIGLLFLFGLWMRNAPGRLLNLLWWVALAKLFLPWAVLGSVAAWLAERFSAGALDGRSLSAAAPPGLTAFVAPMRLIVRGGESGAGALLSSPTLWLLLWLAGAVCVVIVWIRRREPKRGRPSPARGVGEERRACLDSQLRAAGIPAGRVSLVEGREMPKVTGWLRPRILLPLDLVETLDPMELRALLIHEDAHRRRRDPLFSAVGRLAMLCFYYYPLLWPVLGRLRTTAEMACDERVLAAGIPRETYARALARTIGLCLATPTTSPAASGGSASLLRERLHRITGPWRVQAMPRHRIALTLGCLAVLAGSFLPGSPVSAPAKAGESALELPVDHPQRVELRKLAACDHVVRGEFWSMTVQDVLHALGLEANAVITFRGEFPPERRDYRLSGLTLEQSLLEIARQTGVSYRAYDERSLVAFAPPAGPLLAGVGDVTNPVLIPESKVEPVYPEEAAESGLEANVILQATVRIDGTVGDVQVLRTNRPDVGFEEAAVEAVAQWRYEPATRDGLPVPVYFTVFVEFRLGQ